MTRRWFKGDTHLHTTNSDGVLHQYELIERCKKAGLDWAIITDHNYNTVEKSYSSDGLTVIQGQEITGYNGHVNVWGAKVPFEMPYDLESLESYKKMTDAAKALGATVSVNHPFCSNCPYRMELDGIEMDCVEVWNTIQHSDNNKALKWWVGKLDKGEKIGAVGGSDFHRDYGPAKIFGMPTTITHAKSNSPEDILAALREGRSVVTNTPNASMLYLTVEGAELGDSIELIDGLTGKITATKLHRGFTLRVYNNDKLIYHHRAAAYEKAHTAHFGIREKGYVRAEIDYKLALPVKKLLGFAEKNFLTSRGAPVPETADELFWAITNPIWIE
ncbi:MAG: CehA/McbA family metallohydrolase [Eubacterium sp.]|nr:CehA/McbA family metallohydrolase [Eubacterium sp.]